MILKPLVSGTTATHIRTGAQVIIDGVDDDRAAIYWHSVTKDANGRDITTHGISPIGEIVVRQ